MTEGSEIVLYYGLNDTVVSAAILKIEKMPDISNGRKAVPNKPFSGINFGQNKTVLINIDSAA